MRFIPTHVHAPLDYIVGVVLIASPWIFQFSEHTAATVIPIVLGIGLIACRTWSSGSRPCSWV
jgi:hypothetical protein